MSPSQTADDSILSAYLDGELAPDELRAFEARMADSPDTKAQVDDLRALLVAVSRLPTVAPPEDFPDRVARKLRRHAHAHEGIWQSMIALPLQAVSIAFVIAIAAVYMMLQLEMDAKRLEKEQHLESHSNSDHTLRGQ